MAKIFIIEDDLATLKVYKDALTKEGHVVVEESTSDFPLQKIADEKPDIIILDIMLPGKMNGFELLQNFKKDERVKNIPVIVLTNLDTEEKVAKEIGADNYMVKANTFLEDVVGVINKHLSHSVVK
jgi:DNA-binding response OmpR family regulator